jgi:hypothetical protein
MIRNEIERAKVPFKLEVSSNRYGTSLYTVREKLGLDDESFAFIDVRGDRIVVRLELILRIIG